MRATGTSYSGGPALRAMAYLIALVLLVPPLVTMVMSFSASGIVQFPPESWGLVQYQSLNDSNLWTGAALQSIGIAAVSALLSTLVGVLSVLATFRTRLPMRRILLSLGVLPMFLPGVAYAIGVYIMTIRVDFPSAVVPVVLIHAVLALPLVIVVTAAGLARIPLELESVAMSLGASRTRAISTVTLRLLLPSVVAAYFLAFLTSFDEAVFVTFISGPGLTTLPKAIYESMLNGLDPTISAVVTVMMVGTGVLVAAGGALRRKRIR
jgi:ABC-type spermidine/putrescine transport system permease subunit II